MKVQTKLLINLHHVYYAGTTIQCICSSARYTGERCAEDRCDACAKLNQSCVGLTDGIDCRYVQISTNRYFIYLY